MPPWPPPCSTGSCTGLPSQASTDPPTGFATIRTRPTPCARESTHVSPGPTHNDDQLTPDRSTTQSAQASSRQTRDRSTAPRCKSAAHRCAPAGLVARTRPVCDGIFTANPRLRQVYCSPECRLESERQRNRTRHEEQARRLGEHPRTSPPRKPPAPQSPTASPTSPHSGDSSEVGLTVTDHRARQPDGRRARITQVPERSWSSSLPIASRSASCCGPSLNRLSLHPSRG